MGSVLFIAPADLGEAVLSTGAAAHAVGESDVLTVVCSREAAPLFRAAPPLAHIEIWDEGRSFGAWLELARKQLGKQLDLLLDLRGSPAAHAIAAKRRVLRRPPRHLRHLVEDFSELAGADRPLAPKLWLDDAARDAAAAIAPDSAPLLVIAPGGVTAHKRWPQERFAAVARRMASGPLSGARVVVLGAASRDVEITRAIVSSLDADGIAARDLGQGLDLLAAAALLERATLVIGNDNVLAHIAAAVSAPTLTLFGPTDERIRAPYGPRARTLRGRSLEEIAGSPRLDGLTAMGDITIDAVEASALELLHAGGLR